ncbi:MAG: hypothetical protein HY515_00740 [Candidatus Aenigmarchaeota archaeon]|nr:hypothetical protein [Candidatus Aenigmarchaeota archaeon]
MRRAAFLAGMAAVVLTYGMFLGVRRGEKVEAAAVTDNMNVMREARLFTRDMMLAHGTSMATATWTLF